MSRLEVTITDPDGQFAGNWLMGEPVFHREAEGSEIRYTYSIDFLLASANVVLSGSGGSNPPPDSGIEGNYTTYTLKSYCPLNLNSVVNWYNPLNNFLVFLKQSNGLYYLLNYNDGTYAVIQGTIGASSFVPCGHSLTGKYFLTNYLGNINVYKENELLQTITAGVSEGHYYISPNGKYIVFMKSDGLHVFEGS
jgi:hypothetical protein